jgi:2-phospho-L-lactate guanylyltransferase
MAAIVVPFRGAAAKRRLKPLPTDTRAALALAMLGDVLAACGAAGPTSVVTEDDAAAAVARDLGAEVVGEDGARGLGAAVARALERVDRGPVLVVNADLPCAVPDDLRKLAGAVPAGGLALVPALDGTTNALAVSSPELFRPLYGAGSAERFRAHARGLGVEAVVVDIENLVDDVDTLADLERVELRVGPRTLAVLSPPGVRR